MNVQMIWGNSDYQLNNYEHKIVQETCYTTVSLAVVVLRVLLMWSDFNWIMLYISNYFPSML